LKRKFDVVAGPCITCYLERAHYVCDVIIACIRRGMLPALAAIFLLALDYTLQLETSLYLTVAVYEDLYNCGI